MQERRTEPDDAAATADHSPASPARRFSVRHADGLAVLAVLVIVLASAAWFTRSFYYFQDDFIFIRQAQISSLSLTYLRGSLFQHFSPVSRLLDYVLAHWFHSSVAAAHTIELVLLAASVLAFSWTIAELVGRHWWRHLLTLGFAESLALVHLLGWWTATANILPATFFGLLTIAAFLRYRRVGDRRWIGVSLLSYGFSLCTHEQSWLVVGYLILFDLLVLAPGGRLRGAVVRMWREAWIWLGFILLTAAALTNYFLFYYAPVKPRAGVGELFRYVGIQFSQAFAPSAIGLRPLSTEWTNAAALVVDSLVFVLIVTVSIYRRPTAWRVWTVFAAGFLANSIMVGANRVGYFGVDFGQQLYYVQAPAYLFLLCVGASFSLDLSGVAYVMQQEGTQASRVTRHVRRSSKGARASTIAVCTFACGLYGIAFATSASMMNAKDPSSQESAIARGYFTTLLRQVDAASRHGGQVAVLNATVPESVVASAFAPWNSLLFALPVAGPDIAIDQLRASTFDVTTAGGLVPMRFQRRSVSRRGLPVAAVVGSAGSAPSRAKFSRAGNQAEESCFTSAQPGGTIDLRLVSPISTADAWLLVGLTTSLGGTVNVLTWSEGVPAPVGTIDLSTTSQSRDYLLPLSQRNLDHVELSAETAGQNICVSSIDVGTFSPS